MGQSCLEDWATVGANTSGFGHANANATLATMDCPTCRRSTTYDARAGARSLPKNFELLRVRQEIEAYTQAQLRSLREAMAAQVLEKEQLAQEAEAHARVAQRESVQASQRAVFLARQVEINEQEKKRAQELAEDARHRALVASQQAEALQAETERLKQRLQHEAQQLARVQSDATSAARAAQELHSKAEHLQQQVDCVKAQLSLHAGRHDPAKLVVLVCEPTTVGSWLLPYTRYAVISIATDSTLPASAPPIDPFRAAKTWTLTRQVAEPSASVKVYRRYSDFLWLHRELCRQFPFELVPDVPGKQLFFNKEVEFVGERMRTLQAFLRGVLRVPALATAEEVRTFLLATTEELEQLREAARRRPSDSDDLDALALMDDLDAADAADAAHDENDARPNSPPPAPAVSSAPTHSNGWSAWGAVSAFTSSAAKLVTSTGTAALSGLSGNAATSTGAPTGFLPDELDRELSRSLLADESTGRLPTPLAAQRRKYIEMARGYQSVAQKGSQLSRAERRESRDLHRLCELLHEMHALDQSVPFSSVSSGSSSGSGGSRLMASVRDDDDALLRFETPRPFDERASEAFSAISLVTKNNADCMEYALLEAVRMQTLELAGIENAFSRVRSREETLAAHGGGASSSIPTPGSPASTDSSSLGGSPTMAPSGSAASSLSSLTQSKLEELAQHRRALGDKVAALDPARAQFVAQTLRANALEMLKLAKTRRKLFETTYKQLGGRGRHAP